ncbi:DUF3613 domain-containing protein [Pseudomonas guariconensis]|uniref:DUF3613 domain-containing protein n=1 Tax=Pseudomonas guariconensis TaxID=1288410 RepID=UPI0018AC7F55|nr:DUF3613 domain-containing protein [Pseudomonas guariconensis]MBF8723723.1 DUF3613 domain-containing protein [Pseudomonas guariconensis]MBF8740576.1 DUF3613 domain-containing protein [Pseudomonas guariconensis]MBF8750803.1 DUF3613 domain-containing protein [Pseudomonas guariconensis]MBF8795355.1 DUF3613 domain-containing protein [Pseudomonas monteilii]
MYKLLMTLALVASPLPALADEPLRQAPPDSAAEAWLRVQASNQQASPRVQVQTAAERDASMQRWLDSYKYPIPEVFRWQKVSSSDD